MALNVHGNHKAYRDGEKGGKRVWRWRGGGERLYTYRYTVTTRVIPVLRWAAMIAILIFQ